MIYRDEAIILKTQDFRETSKIVVFYGNKSGKISGLFKGIRADPRKFASNLDFLSINEIVFYRKRLSGLHLISQCDLKKGFSFLKTDIDKFSLGGFSAEFIDAIMPPEDAQSEIYELLISFLNSLEHINSPQKLIYIFILKALSLSGFQPHLDSCVICKSFINKHAFFSNRSGGLLCAECHRQDAQSESILSGTIATISFFQKTDWPDSLRLSILPVVENQLKKILFSFLDFNLEKKFKSFKLLNSILEQKIGAAV